MHVATDADGRINYTSEDYSAGESGFEFDFPENFDFGTQSDYRIVDGELIHDPKGPTVAQRAATLRASISNADTTITETYAGIMSGSVTEEQAQACAQAMDNRAAWVAELSEIEEDTGETMNPPSYEADGAGMAREDDERQSTIIRKPHAGSGGATVKAQ